MRLFVLLGALLVFAWAGYLAPTAKPAHYFATGNLLAGLALTAAIALQHTTQVAKLLNPSSKKRRAAEEKVRGLAQNALTELVRGKKVTEDRLGMFVHVWVVPFWYRSIAVYPVRRQLTRLTEKQRLAALRKLTFRPTLLRLAAVGLVKRNSTHVAFVKGRGLVGLCLSNNREDEVLSIDLRDDDARRSLELSDADWANQPVEVTHNLELEEARELALRYGQVIACVVQSSVGEAVGCVTISVPPGATIDIISDTQFSTELHKLAQSVVDIIV